MQNRPQSSLDFDLILNVWVLEDVQKLRCRIRFIYICRINNSIKNKLLQDKLYKNPKPIGNKPGLITHL